MRENEVREAINKLWRNHPAGASTFHECSVQWCTNGARDELCDEHIIETYQGNQRFLSEVLYAIEKYNEAVAALLDVEEGTL